MNHQADTNLATASAKKSGDFQGKIAAGMTRAFDNPATDWNLRQRHEEAMFAWAKSHPAKPLMIAGHTHRPIFGTSRPPKLDLRTVEEIKRELQKAGQRKTRWVRRQNSGSGK